MERTIVFDIDDTISVHHNRDYKNAKPIQPVIDKINRLKKLGYRIKLYTARGQHSCNGDIELIKKRNERVLMEWLEKHGVLYDELIFGKPLADWYIDDKAMNVEEFLKADFETIQFKGGSGANIWLEDKIVIKESKKVPAEYEWYMLAAKNGLKKYIPRIYSRTLDTIYMEFIPGKTLADCAVENDIDELICIVDKFKHIFDTRMNIQAYCKNLLNHKDSDNTKWVIQEIFDNSDELLKNASFCHGDLCLSNVIINSNGMKLIDPNYKDDYSSYLLDLAKIRFSLTGYEFLFGFGKSDLYFLRQGYDKKIKDIKLVQLLEITHWIRLYGYRTDEQLKTIDEVIDKLIKEYKKRWL